MQQAATTGNQYCVKPGAEGNVLKCSDHYGFGTRHCDCMQFKSALQTLICDRCSTDIGDMKQTCEKHVGACYDDHCANTLTDHQEAAQQWDLTECLYTKYTCLRDSVLSSYTIDDERRICPGHDQLLWNPQDAAYIDGETTDSCEDNTIATDDDLMQSAWWEVPRPYKVIEGRGCQNSGLLNGYGYTLTYGTDYYTALPGCARACDMDDTCDGFRLATSDNNSPGACMRFRTTSDADDFETTVMTYCTDNTDQDMYIKTETSPAVSPPPPPPDASPPPPPPAVTTPPPPAAGGCIDEGDPCTNTFDCCGDLECMFGLCQDL